SGMFGIGGGFLTTPLRIFYGIPPAIAVASAATQITGSSVSGALASWQRGGGDIKMGAVLIAGGVLGSGAGSMLFALLQALGQIDVTINIVYVLFLGSIGGLMLREALAALKAQAAGARLPGRLHTRNALVTALPFKMRFSQSGLFISPLAPLLLGFLTGILTVIMGVGGGFVIVPALIYLIGMPAKMVVGTSLFQIIFVTAVTTLLHSVQSQTVDIVLAILLLAGGVIGAQFGVRAAQQLPPERLRLFLALIVLGVALRVAYGLTVAPSELFTVYSG
ncbi:MAG: sulfite exporter TauE/SafE family protein, partial [Polymorphobacter sp.]